MTASALISTRHEYWSLADVYGPIAIGVFLAVLLLVVFSVLRYRRRPHAATWHENTPVEGAYAVLLTLTAAFLLVLTFSHEHLVDTVANRQTPSLVVNVTGSRWEWTFAYPRYGIVQRSGTVGTEPLVVPTNEAIRFNLISQDVIHGFWVPELEFKRDVFPGATESVVLTFTRTGTFRSQCSVFCGLRHPEMIFNTEAVTASQFAAWARSHRGGS